MNQQAIDLAIEALRGWRMKPMGGRYWNHWDEAHTARVDAAIADLQQQGEGVTWEPVPDGALGPGSSLENRTIWLQCNVHGVGVKHGYVLQDDEYLVRRTPTPATVALPVAYLGTLEACVDLASNMRGGDTEEEFARWQAECETVLTWLRQQMPPPAA